MSKAVVVTVPVKTPGEFVEICNAVDRKKPDPAQVRELQKMFDTTPGLWQAIGDVNAHVQAKLIERLGGSNTMQQAMTTGVAKTRESLGHQAAPPLERLLIEHVVTCWLRWQDVEWRYQTTVCGESSITLAQADWWERRLSAAQRRYLRACETLARVRRLLQQTSMIQVNVAAEGGQQVNILGDPRVRGDS